MSTSTAAIVHWKDDIYHGNLIIEAGSRTFCLDGPRLQKHSLGLSEHLFRALEKPASTATPLTGVVKVDDVDPDDLDLVLPIIYGDVLTLHARALFSLHRMNIRFGFPLLMNRFQNMLGYIFPHSFQQFRESYGNYACDMAHKCGLQGNEFKLLKVVTEMEATKYMPMAYLMCLWKRSPSDIALGYEDDHEIIYLTREHQRTLLDSRDVVLRKATEHLYGWLFVDVERKEELGELCEDADNCDAVITHTLRHLADGTLHPLDVLQEVTWEKLFYGKLCRTCYNLVGAGSSARTQRFFSELPTYFGLPPWDDACYQK